MCHRHQAWEPVHSHKSVPSSHTKLTLHVRRQPWGQVVSQDLPAHSLGGPGQRLALVVDAKHLCP
jgi:hypothetical protein